MAETLKIFQQGLLLAVLVSAPPLIIAAGCGMVVSLLQAVTQIQDQTFPYVVKLIAVAVTLAVVGRWIGVELIKLSEIAFQLIPNVGR